MTYDQKLRLSKILVTVGISIAVLLPLSVDFGASHIASDQWSPHARFHLTWPLLGNLFAWPVLLFALWSKLHGTGRSVRLVAFLGMASMAGFFTASAFVMKSGPTFQDTFYVLYDINTFVTFGLVFALLAIGSILSIRRAPKLYALLAFAFLAGARLVVDFFAAALVVDLAAL